MASADYSEKTGLIEPGNINLKKRRPVRTQEGDYATIRSLSFSDQPGVEILIPTVINGKLVDDNKAIEHYYKTGEHLGKYTTPEKATEAAQRLHEAEATRIKRMGYGKLRVKPANTNRR